MLGSQAPCWVHVLVQHGDLAPTWRPGFNMAPKSPTRCLRAQHGDADPTWRPWSNMETWTQRGDRSPTWRPGPKIATWTQHGDRGPTWRRSRSQKPLSGRKTYVGLPIGRRDFNFALALLVLVSDPECPISNHSPVHPLPAPVLVTRLGKTPCRSVVETSLLTDLT